MELNYENSSDDQPAYRYEVEYTTLEGWKTEFEACLTLLITTDADDEGGNTILDEFEKVPRPVACRHSHVCFNHCCSHCCTIAAPCLPKLAAPSSRQQHQYTLLALNSQLCEDSSAEVVTFVNEPDEDDYENAVERQNAVKRYEAFVKLRSTFGDVYCGSGDPVLLTTLLHKLGYDYLKTGKKEDLAGLHADVKKRLEAMSQVVAAGDAPNTIEFKARIEFFLTDSDDGSTGSDWPIITRVRLFSRNWSLLQSGAQLVDAPGFGDANPIRNRVVSGYLEQAQQVWLMLDTTRWASSGKKEMATMYKMMAPVFQKLNANRSVQLCVIMTKVETCYPTPFDPEFMWEQTKDILSLARKSTNAGLGPALDEDTLCSQLKPYPYVLTTSLSAHVQTLDELRLGNRGDGWQELMKPIQRDCLTAHATLVREKMVEMCRKLFCGTTVLKENIFVTSAMDYKAMLSQDGVTNAWTKDQAERTEIPALRRHIHESALTARREQTDPIWKDILRCSHMLLLMAEQTEALDGDTAQKAKECLEKLLADFEPKWKDAAGLAVTDPATSLISAVDPYYLVGFYPIPSRPSRSIPTQPIWSQLNPSRPVPTHP